jgi:hypothetical protein
VTTPQGSLQDSYRVTAFSTVPLKKCIDRKIIHIIGPTMPVTLTISRVFQRKHAVALKAANPSRKSGIFCPDGRAKPNEHLLADSMIHYRGQDALDTHRRDAHDTKQNQVQALLYYWT